MREKDIRAYVVSIQRLSNDLIWVEDDKVCLNLPPDKILYELKGHIREIPVAFIEGSMYLGLQEGSLEDSGKTKKKKKKK